VVGQSFRYGQGPLEPVALEDLQWIGSHHEIIKNGEAEKLQTAHFAILYPNQGLQMNM
jgi:hypothetical protein